jgi:hypothetical protein
MSPLLTGVFASGKSGHLSAPIVGAYDALGTVIVPSGGLASVTFAGIPTGYTHLQIRGIARNTTTSGPGAEQNLRMQFNGDTASNYSEHYIVGDGSSATSGNELTTNIMIAYGVIPMSSETANTYGVFVTDILDYANIYKYKTARSLVGKDTNGAGYIFLSSGSWRNANAITSLVLYPQGGSFQQYSSFALYGVK